MRRATSRPSSRPRLFGGDSYFERADDGRELHVLLRHYAVHHVAYETGYWLVEMGRKPPQKFLELTYQLCRDCGIMHDAVFLVCARTSYYSEDHSGEVTLFYPVAYCFGNKWG